MKLSERMASDHKRGDLPSYTELIGEIKALEDKVEELEKKLAPPEYTDAVKKSFASINNAVRHKYPEDATREEVIAELKANSQVTHIFEVDAESNWQPLPDVAIFIKGNLDDNISHIGSPLLSRNCSILQFDHEDIEDVAGLIDEIDEDYKLIYTQVTG